MSLRELGYVVVTVSDLEKWELFAARNLGAMTQLDAESGRLLVRLDRYSYRILVVRGQSDQFTACGWATFHREEYLAVRARISEAGVEVNDGSKEERSARQVQDFFWFVDPAGNRHEVFWGRTVEATPFISPTGIKHFVTDGIGFGHAVLPCTTNYDATMAFFREVFEFDYSDFFTRELPNGHTARAYFFHPANSRQHSVVLVEAPGVNGLHHLMLEVGDIDDVGRALDRAIEDNIVVRSIGRHVNDGVISFYLRTPAGFQVEYGYGGYQMDWSDHEVVNIPNGTHWGHKWM